MEYIFREFSLRDPPSAGAEEIYLCPRPPFEGRLALARLVLERGLDALLQGPGSPHRLVIPADPTLDDMLAAALVERLLQGQPVAEGFERFAAYAANVREGLKATDLPLSDSLEGIYLAVRREAADDLKPNEAAAAFVKRWRRMAAVIGSAAEAGQDPVNSPLFASDPEFARARAFLNHDRDVYYQQDLPAGERWLLSLPEGPPHELGGLLLRRPRSVLWKYWGREDPEAPGQRGYVFLAVYEQERHWRFSTPPVQQLPIRSLAAALQRAETARNPKRAQADPWYDGQRYAYSLVAAPKEGTLLTEREILRIVRRWAAVRPAQARTTWGPWALAAVAAVLLAIGGFWFLRPSPAAGVEPLFAVSAQVNQQPVRQQELRREDLVRQKKGLFWADFDGVLTPGPNRISLTTTADRINHPFKFWLTLEGQQALTVRDLKLKVNEETLPLEAKTTGGDRALETQEVGALLNFGENSIDVELANSGTQPIPVRIQLNWRIDFDYQRDLYLLAVGVSKYQTTTPTFADLGYADQDAKDLRKALDDQKGKLFHQVMRSTLLVNEEATKARILEELARLSDRAKRAKRPSLVVLLLSGHGKVGVGGRFFYLPYDYNPRADQLEAANAMPWDDFVPYLRDLPGTVLVMMDTCHSGAIRNDSGVRGDLNAAVQASLPPALANLGPGQNGVVTLVACRGDDRTWETDEMVNGALTGAVLEAIQGKRRAKRLSQTRLPQEVNEGDPVTLKDICQYAEQRVKELADGVGGVAVQKSRGMILDFVPGSSVRTIRPEP